MFNLPFTKKKSVNNALVLLIMDGFGIAPASHGNAIGQAKTPFYQKLLSSYPNTSLIASGESVGLPANEVGNTEVGHLTIGAGRVILQDLKKISVAIQNSSFFDNSVLLRAMNHVKVNASKLNIIGLIGSGNVHSSMDHLYGLLQFCKKEDISNVFLHLFTDGRDSPPNESIEVIQKLADFLIQSRLGNIASISGRYFAMDRDRRWDRIEKAYKAMVLGKGVYADSATSAIKYAYSKGQTDEFIEPTVILKQGRPVATVDNGDAAIFFNFRNDRAKELSMAFILPDFENLKSFDFGYDPGISKEVGLIEIGNTFKREKVVKNLFFVTMAEYQKNLPVSGIVFKPEAVVKPLSVVLSEKGVKQIHMAESEKERFVKYYFNGLREEKVEGEEDLIVPSPKVATYDLKPEMSLPKLTSELLKVVKRGTYSFFVVNIANPDMVAHSGNLKATIKAIECVDQYLKRIVEGVLASEGVLFITADHGNAEELLSFPKSSFYITSSQGLINTDHSNNPVPLIVVGKQFYCQVKKLKTGALSDIAPTILNLMGIEKPDEMTGNNLLI